MSTTPDFPANHASDTDPNHPVVESGQPEESNSSKRAVQFVTTLAQRRQVAEWMIQEVARCSTEKHIASKAVRHFPSLFPGNPKANLMRASRIWRQRDQLIAPELDMPATSPHSSSHPAVVGRIQKQALPGRGRKRASWSDALQRDLLREFQRLRCAGLRFSPKVVRNAAASLLSRSTSTEYSASMIDPRSEKPLLECVTSRWVRAFADRYRLPLDVRPPSGNIPESRRLQLELGEKLVAYHLGELARLICAGPVREGDIETLSPVHFVINPANGKTLGFGDNETPQYSELVGGARTVTVLLRVAGGSSAIVEPPFVILQDPEYRYPLLGGPEKVKDVSYRTSPSGWMDRVVLLEYLKEKRAIRPLPNGRRRILMVDPSVWHSHTSIMVTPLKELNTELRYFPQHGSDLVQPIATVIGKVFKDAWVQGWGNMTAGLRSRSIGDEGASSCSNAVDVSPQQLLELAANAVKDVNNLQDQDGISCVRKAMIQAGLALRTNGRWDVEQLHTDLGAIVSKHRQHFEGRIVTAEAVEQVKEESLPPQDEEPAGALQAVQQHNAQPCAPQTQAPDSFSRQDQAPQQHV